jgi:branched-chain amino acid transport system substrate-binding protein
MTDSISGRMLTIYSSLPLDGASSLNAQAVANGARLALERSGGFIGKYRIVLKQLNDSNAAGGSWDAGQTTDNARRAVRDNTTIGYIGELNSGASAISIPILNRAAIAQISPASTAVGLTSNAAGAAQGEPAKYYPTGKRTFARVMPDDSIQAAAQVKLQTSLGCTKTYVVHDDEFDGQAAATSFNLRAQSSGLHLADSQGFEAKQVKYDSIVSGVASTGSNCVFISAITEGNAVEVTKELAAALPGANFFVSSGLAESTYTDPTRAGLPRTLDPRVFITLATLRRSADPSSGRAFLAAYAKRYGPPEPYAIFGYEAMSLMLSAIAASTHQGKITARRSNVVTALFATRHRRSVLGSYSIDPNGDTTLTDIGAYKIVAGQLTFWKTIQG